jgi:hypothetical protein
MAVDSFPLRRAEAEAGRRCRVTGGGAGPEILPQGSRRREAAAGRLHDADQRLGQFRVGGRSRHLVLPELDIAACQSFEIGRLRHGADYTNL